MKVLFFASNAVDFHRYSSQLEFFKVGGISRAFLGYSSLTAPSEGLPLFITKLVSQKQETTQTIIYTRNYTKPLIVVYRPANIPVIVSLDMLDAL